MPTVKDNFSKWNVEHAWEGNGDEWCNQAHYCGADYQEWKRALVEDVLFPCLELDSTLLEIGPGRGRWVSEYAERPGKVLLVELSPQCLSILQDRFSSHLHFEFLLTDGSSLRPATDASVDVVWSYDVFVHIDAPEFRNYLQEIGRVLRSGGVALIHHADYSPIRRFLAGLDIHRAGRIGRSLHARLFKRFEKGWRSAVSVGEVHRWSRQAGLSVLETFDSWGKDKVFNCRLFGDKITRLVKN